MKILFLGGALALLFPAGLWLGAPASAAQKKPEAQSAKATSYEIDAVHSAVIFRVKHMGVSPSFGRFDKLSGTVLFDPAKPEACSVSVEIAADSIDTNNSKRDQHLSGPDFFNVKEFPTITFNSTSVKKGKDGALEVTGDLTLRGETQSVTMKVEPMGSMSDPQHGKKVGFLGEVDFKRSEFGMDYMLPDMLGDDIHVTIGIEAGAKE